MVIVFISINLFSVPYVAMGYEMSDEFHERTNIMPLRIGLVNGHGSLLHCFGLSCMIPTGFLGRCSCASVGHLGRYSLYPVRHGLPFSLRAIQP